MNFGSGQYYEIECFGLLAEDTADNPDNVVNPQQQQQANAAQADQQPSAAMSILLPENPVGQANALLRFGTRLMYYGSTGARET